MAQMKPIRSDEDHRSAVARIDALMDLEERSQEQADELAVLSDLVEAYEDKRFPVGLPSPVEAIRFRMEQFGLEPKDLIPHLGSRGKVSEVLSGKRSLTLAMIRSLHKDLGIPAEVLLQDQDSEVGADDLADEDEGLDWKRLPVVEMARRGWVEATAKARDHAEELGRTLVAAAGGLRAIPMPACRRSESLRQNAKADTFALFAWTAKVLADARRTPLPATYRPGTVDADFMTGVARLSARADGPKVAKEELARHGIHLLVVPHLRRTYLDGAAVLVEETKTPVVALTLRHDRLDSFWFCLLHELGHVRLHLKEARDAFVDDMELRNTPTRTEDPREAEADQAAEVALIPEDEWREAGLLHMPSYARIGAFAQRIGIHQAIVAGRIRYETKDFRKFAPLLGNGEVGRVLMS